MTGPAGPAGPVAPATGSCPEHGPPASPGDRFCEACGRNLRTGEKPAPAPAATVPWLSSRAGRGACAGCGASVAAGDYCDQCGRRRSVARDRAELDLAGLAAVTDRAHRPRNEDAIAIARTADAAIAVVCDGVSTSVRADTAATAAVEAAVGAIRQALAEGVDPAEASRRGARAGSAEVRAVAEAADRDAPPSCTYVSAIGTAESITVAWIGDSRAYWLGPPDATLLTLDDSVRARLAAGRPLPAELADVDPRSASLIRWLGADGDDEDAHVVTLRPDGPGRVVVCSDGLHHYLPEPAQLAAAVSALPASPLAVARGLTRLALDAGGHDNIAVAVLPFPATDTTFPVTDPTFPATDRTGATR